MKLNVVRDTGSYSVFRKMKVLLDGNLIGEIARNETLSFDIPGGLHSVSAKIDWVETNRISFDFDSGDKAVKIISNFSVKQEMKPRLSWNPFKTLANAVEDTVNMSKGKTSSGQNVIEIVDVTPQN